uniref:Uncharacterized protein n=1 Tax=Oryza meridionalis TaxID=40149 RepID=A0A0E0CHU6_9ORYZ
MARPRRLRLLAIVQLAEVLWLAATSGYRCKLDAVPPPPPTELVHGGRPPATPPWPLISLPSLVCPVQVRPEDYVHRLRDLKTKLVN